ncbi:MAG: hypothetical protein N3E48_01455 [Candidatus Bathyarchaeota archaeon]|nr:hypothetical protein [Candidatus Bathyarchaeota archaeon]
MGLVKLTCTGCSLLCEDVNVVFDDKGNVKNVFSMCNVGFEKFKYTSFDSRLTSSFVKVKDKFVNMSVDDAVEKVAEMLKTSKRPLLYGWGYCSCEAVKLGIDITRKLNGVFDSQASRGYWYAYMQAEKHESVFNVLEKTLDYANHVVFLGFNPAKTHPRHASRYSIFPRGVEVEKGVEGRSITVVDSENTETSRIAHNRFIIKAEDYLTFIKTIISLLKGEKLTVAIPEVSETKLLELVRDLKNSSYVSIFYGSSFFENGDYKLKVNAIYQLVEKLRKVNVKCTALPMPKPYNMLGTVKTTLTETGHPCAVDFSSKEEKFNPEEKSAVNMIFKGEVDLALIVGSNIFTELSRTARKNFMKIPVIVLDFAESLTVKNSKIYVASAITGFEVGGTAYRVDGKRIQLTPPFKPPENVLSDEEFLSRVYRKI